MIVLAAFLAMVCVDAAFARYTLAVAARRTLRAAWWAAVVAGAQAVVFVGYVHDWRSALVRAPLVPRPAIRARL